MLFIVDMQNNYIDKNRGEKYIPGSENLIAGIIDKIKEYRSKGDYILYTLDIYTGKQKYLINNNNLEEVEENEKQANKKEKWNFQLYHSLKPYLNDYQCIKKSHYSIPVEELLKLQNRFKKQNRIIRKIEFLGVETNICVLSNAVCVRSAFPDTNIIINTNLTKSSKERSHMKALQVMKALGMKLRS